MDYYLITTDTDTLQAIADGADSVYTSWRAVDADYVTERYATIDDHPDDGTSAYPLDDVTVEHIVSLPNQANPHATEAQIRNALRRLQRQESATEALNINGNAHTAKAKDATWSPVEELP